MAPDESSQQAAGLVGADPAQLSNLGTGDPAVFVYVLQHHLRLLQRLESPLAHVRSLVA